MKTFSDFIRESFTKQPGSQLGSNPGGIHTDEAGKKHYIKHYDNPDQAKVEALTGKIYDHMGIKTINPEMHGDSSIKSKWNEHVSTKDPNFYDKPSKQHAHQLGKMYHAAVLTKNWDVVGLNHDNIVHHKKTGDLHAIDHGGAFHFRAQGGHKVYGSDITEKKSLRDPKLPSGHVFNSAFKHHPEAEHEGLKAVKNMDTKHVRGLFRNSGLKNWQDLHSNFEERRKNLINSYE